MKRDKFYTKKQFHKLSLELLETEIFRIDALLEDHFARSSEKRKYDWLLALRNYLRIDLGYIEPKKIGKGSYTNKHSNTPEQINVAFMWIHGQNIKIVRDVGIKWNPEYKRIEDITESDYDLICKKIKRIESKEDSINSTSDHKFLLGKKMKYEILHSEDVAETKSTPDQGEDTLTKPRKITNENFDNRAISINSDIIDKLYAKLKTYFPKREKDLKKVLKGKQNSEPLIFPHNQNKFVEVFRRLKYNDYLLNTPTEIKDWICDNFKRKKGEEVMPFNPTTVWDILTKGKGEPTKKERICIVDWLPYKSILKLQTEAQKEIL